MKKDKIYPYYLVYLDSKLSNNTLNKGSYGLLKISESAFNEYKYRFNSDKYFYETQQELYKLEYRDKKIEDLFKS